MPPSAIRSRVVDLLSEVAVDGSLPYGTAGFRCAAERLPGALVRVGVLAALRSLAAEGAATGVMVTASHNPAQDNGAKIVDPSGAMLSKKWEEAAAPFVNDPSIANALDVVCDRLGLDLNALASKSASVVIGADTRPSSQDLVQGVARGVRAVFENGVVDLGVVTTPQLHFVVRSRYRDEPSGLDAYYDVLRTEFHAMCSSSASDVFPRVSVDCANGVGSVAMRAMGAVVENMVTCNLSGDGPLNKECGADYVQKSRVMPVVYGTEESLTERVDASNSRGESLWASLDGDADRLVIYKEGSSVPGSMRKSIVLADGDRFSALTAKFISKHLQIAELGDVTIGVAQTAYSNGAATAYLEGLPNVEVVIAKTGVKHLEIAIHPYDIGIYWEPNGHGTVLFSDSFSLRLKNCQLSNALTSTSMAESVTTLFSVSRLANQAVGDGIADLLLVLAILSREQMSFEDWVSMYDERCSSNSVVRVADKNVIETADCDREVVKPIELREAVLKATIGTARRAFVRPSGTEDVVRVYAEAPSGFQEEADNMALVIGRAVHDTCAGVGDRP